MNASVSSYVRFFVFTLALTCWISNLSAQDDLSDPTSSTKEFESVVAKIRGVEELSKIQAEKKSLIKDNGRLSQEIVELRKRADKQNVTINKLQEDIDGLKELDKGVSGELQQQLDSAIGELTKLRKIKSILPRLEVQSVSVTGTSGIAQLKIEDKLVFIRPGNFRNVLMADGQYIRMEVVSVDSNEVTLRFPELNRELAITP
jgi:TolA-binding protein